MPLPLHEMILGSEGMRWKIDAGRKKPCTYVDVVIAESFFGL